jgi:hypothetical protein
MQCLDILREFDDGSRKWMEAATNAEDARARVRALAAQSPGVYVIFDHRTQRMISPVDGRKLAGGATQSAASG